MDPYIESLGEVIRKTHKTGTYNVAWIRSIVDVCYDAPTSKTIHFDQLSQKIFGYYWNQTFFFDFNKTAQKPRWYINM